jgi:hypothetical protein
MAPSAELVALVNQIPDPDTGGGHRNGKLTGPPWPEAEKLCNQILAGGKASIVGLIDMIREADDAKDYKVRYTLHVVATYVCRKGKKAQRATVVKALASQLGGDRPKPVQTFLIQQLQVCGDGSAAPLLGEMLTDEALCDPAAAALVAIRNGADEQFRRALLRAKGKCRLTAVQNLGVLRDAKAVPALKRAAGDRDQNVRAAAVWALANIGDAGSVDLLLRAAETRSGWERIRAADACLLLGERLVAAGAKTNARRVYTRLRKRPGGSEEQHIRDQAGEALNGM